MINLKPAVYSASLIEGYLAGLPDNPAKTQLLEAVEVVQNGLTGASQELLNLNSKLVQVRMSLGETD
jgi:hypothetical protein